MSKQIEHRHRYVVEFFVGGFWFYKMSSRFEGRARRVARYWESLGVYPYRVIDTKK